MSRNSLTPSSMRAPDAPMHNDRLKQRWIQMSTSAELPELRVCASWHVQLMGSRCNSCSFVVTACIVCSANMHRHCRTALVLIREFPTCALHIASAHSHGLNFLQDCTRRLESLSFPHLTQFLEDLSSSMLARCGSRTGIDQMSRPVC